jgi:phage shock protein B
MEGIAGILIVPMIIFLIFVAPVWLVMHYRSQRQVSQGLSESEIANLNSLAHKAELLGERVKTLESILDAESPEWRRKV